jgi:hypothetical protein
MVRADPQLEVLFISGYTGAEVCRNYGVSLSDAHFLAKPFDPETLVNRVGELLDARERHDFGKRRSPAPDHLRH